MSDKPLNILVYASVFYPGIGGIENHTLFLVKEFVRKGHAVRVVTEQVQDPNRPLEGIEVIHASNKWQQLKAFFWSDLIYMPNITLKGIWLFAFNPFKKWVISHNDFHLMYTSDWKTRFKNFLIKRATANIAVSKSVARFLKVKSQVIYNCYDNDVFKRYEDEQRQFDFVFVGRLVSQKGCDMLIDACSQLNQPFTLNIVGDGYEYQALKEKVAALQLGDSIQFLGFKQGEVLARCLNQHRTMIVPSLDVEGFGIVALEGLACGCQMIVSDAGGLPEAVEGHGKVFPMKDTQTLTILLKNTMQQHTSNPETPELTSYLDAHSKSAVANQYLSVFQQII
jgi:glycosyltransferase involved in cell wall biosynthesis